MTVCGMGCGGCGGDGRRGGAAQGGVEWGEAGEEGGAAVRGVVERCEVVRG